MKYCILLMIFSICLNKSLSQTIPKLTIKGTAGVSYEGYGLTTNPKTPNFYTPRRPWHLVRFNFRPEISYGKFKMPVNFNISPMRNNFGFTPFGFGNLPGFPKQTIKQWLTNPINSIGLNPSYKWAELQLGTQYVKLSDLSTGDIGIFGYGTSLKPGNVRFKFFDGRSQQAYEPFTGVPANSISPVFAGTYARRITMAQIGLEKEDQYFAGFNIVKGKDKSTSIIAPIIPTPKPEENLIISFNATIKNALGWYGQTEIASTFTSRDSRALGPGIVSDYKPFINTNTSSYRDHAAQGGIGRKTKNLDLGASVKWLGAGYTTMGYPFSQNDRLEYSVNSKFNILKNSTNIVANIGQRFGNWSVPSSRTRQIIANVNIFTQINDKLSVNANYNNFGFQTPTSLGIRNVGNELGINPNYVWTTSKMSNLISVSYNWSKYDEFIFPGPTTTNNTHTGLLLYAPSFFSKPDFSPDFSLMYFSNKSSLPSNMKLYSVSSGLAWNKPNNKLSLKGQLLYNNTTILPFTASNNILATISGEYKISKKLNWNLSMTGNFNKYGNELTPPPALLGAQYLESSLKTSLTYKIGK